MASDTTISTIALAVALVALITTASQVLGQFLATADVYRTCQSSVMGRWAKLTHRTFRFSEMRFETLYTSCMRTYGMRSKTFLKPSRASMPHPREQETTTVCGWRDGLPRKDTYFHSIPKVVEDMRSKGFDQPEIVEEAWLTMMWKAFLWHRFHFMVEGARVPSSNWGSRLPVYIG